MTEANNELTHTVLAAMVLSVFHFCSAWLGYIFIKVVSKLLYNYADVLEGPSIVLIS